MAVVMISCEEASHEHSYGTEWKSDGAYHWHECECGEKSDEAAHTYGSWTLSKDEKTVSRTCSVCKYTQTENYVDTSWADETKKEFTLTNAAQLRGLAKIVNDGSKLEGITIKLGNDIDLQDIQWTPIGLYSDENDTDAFVKKIFSGTFDGQGHTISGLKIELDNGKSSYRALFGYVDGTIKNFTVEGTIVACDSSGVVAALDDGGVIEGVVNRVNVSVTKAIEGTNVHAKVAGIVVAVKNKKSGTTGCIIKNCKNEGTITSTTDEKTNDAVGGILAWCEIAKLTIENCENSGKVTGAGKQNAGGIIGAVWKNSSISSYEIKLTKCTNQGTITAGTGDNVYVGGIVGRSIIDKANLTVTDCTTTGDYNLVGSDNSYNTTTT